MPDTASMNEKLDAILLHLERMDRRDSLRTWAGFVRSLITLIPVVILLVSTWVIYAHWNDILRSITNEMTQQLSSFVPKLPK